MEILGHIVYGNVTVWNILVFVTVVIISVLFAKIVRINLKKALSDRIPRNELDILLKITTPLFSLCQLKLSGFQALVVI